MLNDFIGARGEIGYGGVGKDKVIRGVLER